MKAFKKITQIQYITIVYKIIWVIINKIEFSERSWNYERSVIFFIKGIIDKVLYGQEKCYSLKIIWVFFIDDPYKINRLIDLF